MSSILGLCIRLRVLFVVNTGRNWHCTRQCLSADWYVCCSDYKDYCTDSTVRFVV